MMLNKSSPMLNIISSDNSLLSFGDENPTIEKMKEYTKTSKKTKSKKGYNPGPNTLSLRFYHDITTKRH